MKQAIKNQTNFIYIKHFYLVNKKEADSSFKTGNSQKATPSDVSTSIFIILRRIKNVKNSFTVDTEETERIQKIMLKISLTVVIYSILNQIKIELIIG